MAAPVTVADILRSQTGKDGFARTMRMGSDLHDQHVHLPTGIAALDIGLHGGLPMNKQTMVVGWESAGKTELMWRCVASAQRHMPDRVAAVVDTEHSLDLRYARDAFGVDLARLVHDTPETGEEAAGNVERFTKAVDVSFVALDSLPTLVPASEVDEERMSGAKKVGQRDFEDEQRVGEQASLVQRLLRRVTVAQIKHGNEGHLGPCVYLVNQWRDTVGGKFVGKRMPGGRFLKYMVSLTIDVTNKGHVGSEALGNQHVKHTDHTYEIVKSKLGNSERAGEWRVIRDVDGALPWMAVDQAKPILAYAKLTGLYTGSGKGGFAIQGVNERFQNADAAVAWLQEEPARQETLARHVVSANRARFRKNADGWHVADFLASRRAA